MLIKIGTMDIGILTIVQPVPGFDESPLQRPPVSRFEIQEPGPVTERSIDVPQFDQRCHQLVRLGMRHQLVDILLVELDHDRARNPAHIQRIVLDRLPLLVAPAIFEPIDRRQNVLLNKGLWVYAAAVLLLFGGGIYFAYRFFVHKGKAAEGQAVVSASALSAAAAPGGASGVPAPAAAVKAPEVSETWRVMGRFESGDLQYVVLADDSGRMRVDSPAAYNGMGAATAGRVDGQRVTMWSGKASAGPASLVPGGKSK